MTTRTLFSAVSADLTAAMDRKYRELRSRWPEAAPALTEAFCDAHDIASAALSRLENEHRNPRRAAPRQSQD